MDHERLVDEAYLELVGNDVINKSALRRLCEGYDARSSTIAMRFPSSPSRIGWICATTLSSPRG